MPDSVPDDISLADVEDALEPRLGRLRFASTIEARFEADTGRQRCRRLAIATLVGSAFFIVSLRHDASLLPDMLDDALALKLGLIAPLFLLSLFVFSRNPPPWLRESIIMGTAITIMSVQMFLLLSSSSPLAAYAAYSAPLDFLFVNLIVRARFWYALTASAAALFIYGLSIAHLEGLPHEARVDAVIVVGIVAVCTLFANFQLERDERRAYLIGLRGRVRSGLLARANQELSRISNLDALTGLTNRRGFDQRIGAIWSTAERDGQPIAVMMLDVDNFKRFNDHYGHQAGDVCLKEIADIMRSHTRGGDELVARFGGEEFIAVLPGADLVDGIRAAERVRRAIESRAIRHECTPLQVVTVSLGVAAAPATSGGSTGDVIESADAALYEAKRRGRNRVWPPLLTSGSGEVAETGGAAVADVA